MTDSILILAAQPFDPSAVVTLAGPPMPFGTYVVDADREWSYTGSITTRRWAERPFATGAADTPPHTQIEGRLIEGFSYQDSLFSGGALAPRSQAGFGALVIDNADGALDDVVDYGWDGRRLQIFRGAPDAAFADFELVGDVTCDGIEWDARTITIRLRNRQAIFDRPLQTRLYSGDGGLDGGSAVQGKPAPIALGQVANGQGAPMDVANAVYQFHDGAVVSIDAVRDSGVALTFAADYASYDALIAATTGAAGSGADIEAGEYATCLAQGLVRTGGAVVGTLTADLTGDTLAGATYPASTASLVRRIATAYLGALSVADPGGIDTAAFAALDTAQPATVGFFAGHEDSYTAGDACDRLMAGIGGRWGVTPGGLLTVLRLGAPGVPAETLGPADFDLAGDFVRTGQVPPWRVRVGVPNWTVQSGADLADSVSPDNRALWGASYSYPKPATDESVHTGHRLADDRVVPSCFADLADAEAEEARLLALYSGAPDLYRTACFQSPFDLALGATYTVGGESRWGLPKAMILVGLETDRQSHSFTAEFWG